MNSRPSLKVTLTVVAPETTCRLVTMSPRPSITTPEPVPRWGPRDGSGVPTELEEAAQERRHLRIVASSLAALALGRRATSTSMRTTDGLSARATAEKAFDRTRASLGACVLGVTAPPAGARAAALGSGRPPAPAGATVVGEPRDNRWQQARHHRGDERGGDSAGTTRADSKSEREQGAWRIFSDLPARAQPPAAV